MQYCTGYITYDSYKVKHQHVTLLALSHYFHSLGASHLLSVSFDHPSLPTQTATITMKQNVIHCFSFHMSIHGVPQC